MSPVIWRLMFVVVPCNLTFVGGKLALLLAAKNIGGSPVEIGVLVGLSSLSGMAAVWVGRWFDRYDARRLLIGGTLLLFASGALIFVHLSLGSILISALLVGSGITMIQVGWQQLTGDYSTGANRTKHYNFIAMGGALAMMLGPLIAGFSIDHLGYRAAFLLLGVLSLISFGALALGQLPERAVRHAQAGGGSRANVVMLVVRDPGLRRLFILELIFSLGWDALIFLVPLYGAQLGLSASVIGMIASASSLATLLVRLIVPSLTRRLGLWPMLALALALTGVGFVGFPLASAAPMLAMFAFVIGAGLGIGLPVAMTLVYELSPSARVGEVIGLRVATLRGCHTVLPLLAGNLGAVIGIAPVFWCFALLVFAGSWSAFAQSRKPQPGSR